MYLGLDLGTSSVKAMLIDGDQKVVGVGHAGLSCSGRIPAGRSRRPATGFEQRKRRSRR